MHDQLEAGSLDAPQGACKKAQKTNRCHIYGDRDHSIVGCFIRGYRHEHLFSGAETLAAGAGGFCVLNS